MSPNLACGLALVLLLALTLSAAIVDLRRMIIPNQINLALGLSGLLVAALSPSWDLADAFLGLSAAGLSAFALRLAYRQFRGFEGLGLGDVKFIAAGGAWTGLEDFPVFLLLAALCGLAYVALRAMLRRPLGKGERIPFGPCLASGLIAVAASRILTGTSIYDLLLSP
jgi:leader peptidase (prepilin peptidase)/N-methyltransferase